MIAYESWNAKTADTGILQQCKQAICRVLPDAEVILYGSRARGDAAPDSDYDILVLTDKPVNVKMKEDLISSIYPTELGTGAVMTLIAYNRKEWNSQLRKAMPFRKNIELDGVLL
jgi:predicted nucleotidyltransferase